MRIKAIFAISVAFYSRLPRLSFVRAMVFVTKRNVSVNAINFEKLLQFWQWRS